MSAKRKIGNIEYTTDPSGAAFRYVKVPRLQTYVPIQGYRGQTSRIRQGAETGTRAGYQVVQRTPGVYGAGEMKYFDTEFSGAIPSVAAWTGTEMDPATFLTLCVPVVGSAINQRIGRAIKVHKIKIRGIVTCAAQVDQTAGDAPAVLRLILYQDMQTNASQAQGEQVMTGATTSSNVNMFQNIDNFGRFRVLKDKIITMANPNFTWDGTNLETMGLARTFKMNINFKVPVEIRFNATNGGTIADIVDNSFHVIANAYSTGLVPTLNYACRVCYKE